MVGATHYLVKESNHIKGKILILENDTQVWNPLAEVSQRSTGDQQNNQYGLLEKGDQQRDDKGENRMDNT